VSTQLKPAHASAMSECRTPIAVTSCCCCWLCPSPYCFSHPAQLACCC
jgi:hypothetical protein